MQKINYLGVGVKKRIKLILFFCLFFVLAPLILLYANGDILGSGWTLLSTGGIYINSAPSGSNIFLNDKLKDSTSFFSKNIVLKNLHIGTYDIKVEKEGYNTWIKKIKVFKNLVSDANVFMLPEKIEVRQIPKYIASTTKTNSEYADILSLFAKKPAILKTVSTSSIDLKSNLGTKLSPIMSGKIGIWREGYFIYAKWFGREDQAPRYFCNEENCSKTIQVVQLEDIPMRFDFLSGYSDVIVVALNQKVFALQIEENTEKKNQLIYEGNEPDIRLSGGALYIKDGHFIGEAVL